ncbi:hypothetical protein J9253_13515 [Thiothrix litoralis]|jgi:DNA repair exonuclease SbcCD ATPase subunit|uniref:Chromosome partition protein Smc n=1 Tax=Thiothrix litoralis TaxID=2891210 RepID=A0ABX7WNK5_9GAMM|nr:hypothetical protein [Thiothrix litoralis]QTR45025.1 hypothetical protein J9253_13515 [Thiothrix litoralis]
MLGYIDWIIILVALMAAIGAVLLLLPQTNSKETQGLRVVRLQAEADRKRVADVLEVTQHGAQDAESLLSKLKAQVEQTTRSYEASQARAEQAERIIERVTTAEQEIRDISSQLGDRLQHLQGYWDEQLGDSVESVKRIRSKLHEGLTQVDDSLIRLREQEKMAQGFTRRLLNHHQEQAHNQQENARMSAEVHNRLEAMLKESSHLLEQMQRYQQDADTVFLKFNTEMEGLESQASEHFSTLSQSTDLARHELTSGLEESRKHVETMRRREEQSNDLSRRIHQQFEQIDHIRVERIAKTLDLTEQMSSDLHKGMENARDLLFSLEVAVQNVTTSLDAKQPAAAPAHADESEALPLMQETLEASNSDDAAEIVAEVEEMVASATPTQDAEVSKLADIGNLRPVKENEEEPTPHNLMALRAYR